MSAILDQWKAGLGFPDAFVIDGHIHIGEWIHAATFSSVNEAADESVAYLDAHGVDAFCAVGGGHMFDGADPRGGNDFLLAVWGRLPERMIPFLCVNPNAGKDNVLAELERMFDEGMRCIKLINSYQENYPGDGPNLMVLYEYAAAHNMLVFNHSWRQPEIEKISALFPDTVFVFAHYGEWQDAILRDRPNVYANIWGLGDLGWLDRAFANVGAGKFMMGSDGFLNPLSCGIGPVVFSPIPDEEKRLVLGLTAAQLLDRVGALPPSLKRKAGI